MDKAEAELSELAVEANHVAWLQQTHISDETQLLASKAQQRFALRLNEVVVAARRFDELRLPAALARRRTAHGR